MERIGGSKRTIYNEFGSKAASGSSARVLLLNLTSHCPRSRFARQPHYLGGADAPIRSIEPTRNGSLAWTGLSGAESIGLRLQQK
ncbi:hypothetical protein ACQ5SK_10140 [Bradyrhizobium japonicum]